MQTIKNIISKLTYGKYIHKDDKTKIKELIDELDTIKYNKLIVELKTIMNKSKFTKPSLALINKLLEELQDDDMTINKANELIEDTIKEIEDNDLEFNLDMDCDRYNKFTESNPAEYIRYDKTNKKYILDYNSKINRFKDLKKLVNILKVYLRDEKEKNFPIFVLNKKIEYKNKKIIIYITNNNQILFDINHVINLFDDLKSKKDKYKEYKSNIIAYDFRDNNYGGFYIKEFITKENFFKMLLHTNSLFSNKFKDDVSKLLDELTNKNMIMVKDKNLVFIDKPTNLLVDKYVYTQTYSNTDLLDFIKSRIAESKKMNWNKYVNKHIMYFFVITLDDPDNLNRILCKIGYSCDLIDRFKSLENEYKCKFYLLNVKLIHSVHDEKNFHSLLKKKFPELVVNCKIGNHNKDETYVFDINLYKEFLYYVDKNEFTTNEITIENEANNIINNYFDNIEERFNFELISKIKYITNINDIVNDQQANAVITIHKYYYDLILNLKIKELEHKERIIEKELEYKTKELEYKTKELDKKSL